jgi:signal transduction histidine kinase/CheY-like chemotaxis protein
MNQSGTNSPSTGDQPPPSAPADPAVGAIGSATLRRRITIAGVGLIFAIIAADAYEGWQDYRSTIAANERVQVALGRAIAGQTERLVQEADVVLAGLASWRGSAEGRAASEDQLHNRLRAAVAGMPFVYSGIYAGPDGGLLASTQEEQLSGRSIEKWPAFTGARQAAGTELRISPPYTSRRDGTRTFAVSRRLEAADGTFAGVVVLRVSFDYLASFYSKVEVTPDTAIDLVRTDGTTLVHFPVTRELPGTDAFVRSSFASDEATDELSHYSGTKADRLFSVVHAVDGYPMVVSVSRPMSAILQPWVEQELASAARTLTLAVLAGLLLMGLRAALARHDRMEIERRRLEQSVADSQRSDALGMLAAAMAHDFNNVLTAIVGYAELAGKDLPDGPATHNISRLLASTERARQLVRRVLTFDPHRSLSYQPVPVAPIVQEVLQQLQPGWPDSVGVRFNGVGNKGAVLGDATELHQVVMNLCTNAIKAMPGGGALEVGLEVVHVRVGRALTLGSVGPGSWVRLSISDRGTGLSPGQVARMFEPFYTTQDPGQGQGTGIGLTVVRNIILRMNGALEVETRPGEGTRMHVYWRSVSPPERVAVTAPGRGGGQTILLVDDDSELVVLAEDMLASLGYEPIGFSDSGAALDAFRRDPERFHAVLTDERMMNLRGVDFAARVRGLSPKVPIILMTGHRNTEVEVLAARAGVAMILDKPLRLQALQAALDRELAAAPA